MLLSTILIIFYRFYPKYSRKNTMGETKKSKVCCLLSKHALKLYTFLSGNTLFKWVFMDIDDRNQISKFLDIFRGVSTG